MHASNARGTEVANEIQERYAESLAERIRNERNPSATTMNMLEAIAPPRVLAEYTLALIERIEGDIYPSVSLMRRVERLVGQFG